MLLLPWLRANWTPAVCVDAFSRFARNEDVCVDIWVRSGRQDLLLTPLTHHSETSGSSSPQKAQTLMFHQRFEVLLKFVTGFSGWSLLKNTHTFIMLLGNALRNSLHKSGEA